MKEDQRREGGRRKKSLVAFGGSNAEAAGAFRSLATVACCGERSIGNSEPSKICRFRVLPERNAV